MALTSLNCAKTQVSRLGPLKGMPLRELNCSYCYNLADLSPLEGMPIQRLSINGDINNRMPVHDLGPLQGMPLSHLDCYNTLVSNLSPLRSMPLLTLNCAKTPVSDLAPLKGMPLTTLVCSETRVTDLSPLEGMPLQVLWFPTSSCRKGLEVVRRIKSMREIGDVIAGRRRTLGPDEFWRKYDAGAFSK